MSRIDKRKILTFLLLKGVPMLLLITVITYVWKSLLTDEFRDQLIELVSLSSYTRNDVDYVLKFILLLIIWGFIWLIILAALFGMYRLFDFTWMKICITMRIVHTEKTPQVIYVRGKRVTQHSSTTYVESDGTYLPVTSDYECYFVDLKVGNKDAILQEIEVTYSQYSELIKGCTYKITLRNYKILGNSVGYKIDLSDPIEI
ncbi:hypothetical protein [uncultured Enterococcus sp.]|uniref:hypothetical protein n=1 Tax=uncultured Enterococcus sp. TaxID=167972 RepID=UPI002AA64DAA|nr:hypothetical protein [uncultured Enterococcus sp.]